jgi:glycosyltransferase involved in cell wall biosynthesis
VRVCFYVFFPAGGIGRYTNELMRALSARPGVKVEVACTPDFQWANEPGYQTWAGLRSISHPLSLIRRFRFLRAQFENPVRFIRRAVEAGADVVHFANVNHLSFPYWRRALEKSGLRVAISVHDVRRQKSILHRTWEEQQLKAVYHSADALFVHSAYQANELVTYANVTREKIHVVPHGPYPHGRAEHDATDVRKGLGLPQDRQVALFFGQLRDEKNLEGLIRAVSMSSGRPHLLVAGSAGGGRHRSIDFYRGLAREVGVEDCVTFVPRFIPDEEVGDLFAASDWVALPYSNSFTSQSGVLNIAAHYERPVLVSSSPVLHETVRMNDIGVACDGDEPGSLATGIDKLCMRIRKKHPHAFAQYRQQFSWDENARLTSEVYWRMLAAESGNISAIKGASVVHPVWLEDQA